MLSVRNSLNCIGRNTSGSNSVLGDLFGFWRKRVPSTGTTTFSVSLKNTMDGLQGRHVHLNIIKVGFHNESNATDRDNAMRKIDFATMRTRQIFEQADLGVGRVGHYHIDQADADGYDNIGSSGEADDLSDDWGVDNDGIDCFVPRTISASGEDGFVGISPLDGDCSKGGKRDGLIAGAIDRGGSVSGSFDRFARTFAHEIGHYMTLPHNHDDSCPSGSARNNLMAQTRCISISARDAVTLTSGQGSDMRGHCTTKSGC